MTKRKNIDKLLVQVGRIAFWVGLIIETLLVMIDKSNYINPYEGILFRFTFVLFCIKILTTRNSRKEWICIIFFGMLAVVSYLINTRDELVRAVALVTACKDIDIKSELKTVLGLTMISSLVLLILSVFGIFGNLTMTANFGRGPFPGIVETRYCFGMGHPNAFQCMILMMSILALYIYHEKAQWYHFMLLLGVNYVFYRFTDSNTSFLICFVIIGGILVLKYIEPLQSMKWVYVAGALIVLGVVVFSAIGSYTGRETKLMYDIDQILNGRFQYAHVVEDSRIQNWKLFAKPENVEYFDSGFIRLFYWYGIVPGIVYVFAHLFLIYESYKYRDYSLLVIIVGLSIFMLMEAHCISVYLLRNYLLLWLGYYWSEPLNCKNEMTHN